VGANMASEIRIIVMIAGVLALAAWLAQRLTA
jgi:hypothetical protein